MISTALSTGYRTTHAIALIDRLQVQQESVHVFFMRKCKRDFVAFVDYTLTYQHSRIIFQSQQTESRTEANHSCFTVCCSSFSCEDEENHISSSCFRDFFECDLCIWTYGLPETDEYFLSKHQLIHWFQFQLLKPRRTWNELYPRSSELGSKCEAYRSE